MKRRETAIIRGLLRARTEDFSSVAEGGVQMLSLSLIPTTTLYTIVTNFNFVTLMVESLVPTYYMCF